jgi:uncharacterized protein (DUF1499 family)
VLAADSAHLGAILMLVSLAVMLAAPLGFRLGLWTAVTALTKLVPMGLVTGALAALAALVSLATGGWRVGVGTTAMLLGIVVLGGAAVLLPLRAKKIAERAPINDITTDTADPPAFAAAIAARSRDGAVSTYPGAPTVAIQHANYSDLAPLRLALAPAVAFQRALATAKALGWRVLAADAESGLIEASDKTLIFGFVDDVVLRLRPEGGGTRIDLRSASRVGISDLGKNAKRIRTFFAALATEAP